MTEPTQADRNAANTYCNESGWRGRLDRARCAQAFTKHREDTEKRIVEWLRAVSADYEEQERAGGMPADGAPYSAAAMEFADMLERGDHHITKGD